MEFEISNDDQAGQTRLGKSIQRDIASRNIPHFAPRHRDRALQIPEQED